MDGPRNRGYGARSGYDVRTRCVCGRTERRQRVSPESTQLVGNCCAKVRRDRGKFLLCATCGIGRQIVRFRRGHVWFEGERRAATSKQQKQSQEEDHFSNEN